MYPRLIFTPWSTHGLVCKQKPAASPRKSHDARALSAFISLGSVGLDLARPATRYPGISEFTWTSRAWRTRERRAGIVVTTPAPPCHRCAWIRDILMSGCRAESRYRFFGFVRLAWLFLASREECRYLWLTEKKLLDSIFHFFLLRESRFNVRGPMRIHAEWWSWGVWDIYKGKPPVQFLLCTFVWKRTIWVCEIRRSRS